MFSLALVAAAVLAFLFVWHFKGGAVAATLAVLAACALSTVDLVSIGGSGVLTATAASSLTLSTYHLALLGGFLALPHLTLRSISPWFFLFLLALGVLMLARGMTSPHIWSGFLQWGTVVLAFGVGGAIATSSVREDRPTARLMSIAVAVIVGWHAAAVALQLAGLRAVSSIDAGGLDITRASGIAGHSGNLGKVMFVLIMIVLPLTRSADIVARRWAVAAVVAAATLTGLSFSRANTVAVVMMLLLWLLLGPGISIAKRFLVPAIGLVAALPIIDVLVLRNQYDPDGGSRPQLMETAWHQIGESLWLGVGPNNYLNVVGRYDALAAGGLPVHSAFVLALAELGLFCAILVALPLIGAVFVSVRRSRKRDVSATYAVALVASVPGIVVIASTGWGLLREQYLVLLFFALGYLVSAQRAADMTFGDRPALTEETHAGDPQTTSSAGSRKPARRNHALYRPGGGLR